MNSIMVETAKSYAKAGLSVIPTCADKRPACAWKTFTERIMSEREIEMWFREGQRSEVKGQSAGTALNANPSTGIGIVCGKVSGNLELLDFDDGGSAFEPWICTVPTCLAQRLIIERSPSGGYHVFYRVGEASSTPVPGNRKLAMTADGHVLIETRGEGGYVKCAPSAGYKLMTADDFTHIPTISPFEQKVLIDAAIARDERGATVGLAVPREPHSGSNENRIMGTNAAVAERHALPSRSAPSAYEVAMMEQALVGAGWKKVRDGAEQHWERPGKNERSTSATFNGEVFYVFSSNAAPFEPNRGYGVHSVLKMLGCGVNSSSPSSSSGVEVKIPCSTSNFKLQTLNSNPNSNPDSPADPGPLPEVLLHVPGFVDQLTDYTLATAPYPNRPLAFAGALTMLAHLTGRNFRDARNLRTNLYLLALADSGVGKDYPRKVNMNLATEVGIMPTMADRFASAEGLEDALLVHPASFFQVDEVDTLFAALQEKKDSAIEKIYGALLQFATSSDTTYAMRKKAIQQTSGKAAKFDKVRARGIREPHLTMLGCAIPKYLYSALSERAMENGLISRCLILEAGTRGKAGNPHAEPFGESILDQARHLVSLGGFEGLDLENLEEEESSTLNSPQPYTVTETEEALAQRDAVVKKCEGLYDAANSQAEKALWTRGAEKASRLALLYAISENVREPIITPAAIEWGWAVVEHLTRRMLYQATVYLHDNEFDALRQKALRYLRDYGKNGTLTHGQLLKRMHIDADTFRKVIDTLIQSELIVAKEWGQGRNIGIEYVLLGQV